MLMSCNQQAVRIMIPHDDEYLKSIQRFGYCAALLAGGFSLMILNFGEDIVKYADSTDICENEFVYEMAAWMLPKIRSHCDLILTVPYWHIYAKIGIIWDLWLIALYVCSAILGFRFFLAMYSRTRDKIYCFVAKHRVRFILISLVNFWGAVLLIYYVFFDFPFLEVDKTRHPSWVIMEMDRYGIHASGVALAISYVSYLSFSRVLLVFLATLNAQRNNSCANWFEGPSRE